MAFYFRRSKKLGPFRISLSNRGVGASVGGKFWRLSGSPTGRVTRTFRLPGTGMSWRTSSRRRRR